MVQLLNLAIPSLAAPALHNSGFAVSHKSCFRKKNKEHQVLLFFVFA